MAVTPKKLIPSRQITTAMEQYYIANNVTAIIDKFTLTNTTGSAVSATVDAVDVSGTAGVTERLISAHSIGAGETYTCPEIVGHILGNGDTIMALASADSALTIRVSGREVSGL
jgi:hypothetical protein